MHKFFDDPSELDDHIIPIIREYINSGDWDLVLEEIEKHLSVLKAELLSLDKRYPDHGFWLLVGCKTTSDVNHTRGIIKSDKGEAFRTCLMSLLGIRDTLLYGHGVDFAKEGFLQDIEKYQIAIKEILLRDAMPQIWQKDKSLKQGRKQPKGLKSLQAFIQDLIVEYGQDITPLDIKKKIRKYTDDSPYLYQNFEMKYDPESETIYQVDQNTGQERKAGIKKIYDYLKRAKTKTQKK